MLSKAHHLETELANRVQARTGRRVRQLAVELVPEGVVLRGMSPTYYVKQLAQEEVCDVLPHLRLQNSIIVHSEHS